MLSHLFRDEVRGDESRSNKRITICLGRSHGLSTEPAELPAVQKTKFKGKQMRRTYIKINAGHERKRAEVERLTTKK